MAKKEVQQNETPQNEPQTEKHPVNALKDDWPLKHDELAPYITKKGQIRGGLKPSDQEKARAILKRYGF